MATNESAERLLASVFAERLHQRGIEIAADGIAGVASNARGEILQGGWTIYYRFGREGERMFLYYFASHRMTNDTLWRIHDDGSVELLDACQEFYLADDPEAARACRAQNRAFYANVAKLIGRRQRKRDRNARI